MNYITASMDLKKITIPTIVAYGVNDSWINPKQSLDFYNAHPAKKILMKYEEGDHYMTAKKTFPTPRNSRSCWSKWILDG